MTRDPGPLARALALAAALSALATASAPQAHAQETEPEPVDHGWALAAGLVGLPIGVGGLAVNTVIEASGSSPATADENRFAGGMYLGTIAIAAIAAPIVVAGTFSADGPADVMAQTLGWFSYGFGVLGGIIAAGSWIDSGNPDRLILFGSQLLTDLALILFSADALSHGLR